MNTANYSKLWSKGAEYCRTNRVTIEQDRIVNAMRVLNGKVSCNFGYVHRPTVAVDEKTDSVAAALCDCYEFSESEPFCSHCAAVVRAVYRDRIRRVAPTPTLNLKELSGIQNTHGDKVSLLKIIDDGISRRAEGIARCNFGFVHRPSVTVEDGEIVAYLCDCYAAAESDAMCPHCKTLYGLMPDADSAEITDEAGTFVQEREADPETPTDDGDYPTAAAASSDPAANASELPCEQLPSADAFDPQTVAEESPCNVEDPTEVRGLFDDVYVPQALPEDALDAEESAEAEAPEQTEPPVVLHEPESMEILFGTSMELDEKVCWYPNDTTKLFHTNTGIIGTMGTGKTQFTKAMIAQLYWEQSHNFTGTPLGILVFDYKGDYNESKPEFVQAVSARVLKPHKLPFNPFALAGMKHKPQLPLQVASTFATILEKIYHLGPKQVTTLRHCIIEAYKQHGISASNAATWNRPAPTFDDVYEIYCADEEIKKNDSLFSAMDLLHMYEIFENDVSKTTSLYEMLKGVVSVDLSGYDAEIQHLVVAIMLELFYSQMQNTGSSQMSGNYRQITKFLLVDEADNFMSQGFGVLKKIMKEGREFGVGTILSTQSLEHFSTSDDNYASLILTWVIHQVPDLKRTDIEFLFNLERNSGVADTLLHRIKALQKHQSMTKIGTREPECIYDKPFWQLLEER